jgi:hypothetical protein
MQWFKKVNMRRLPSLCAAVVLAVACGKGPNSTLPSDTFQVTGATTESGTCHATAAYSASNNVLSFSLAGSTSLTFTAQLPGTALTAGSFTQADVQTGALNYYDSTSGKVWLATVNAGGQGDQGSFTLDLTDAGPSVTSVDGAAWLAPHGTLEGTLPAVTGSGASGNVMVDAAF